MNDLKARFHVPLIALWVTLSLAGVALSWTTWRRLADTVETGVRRAAMNDHLDGVFGALLNAETGERGFIITGKEAYLTPLHEAETSFGQKFEGLTALAANDPQTIQYVVQLRGLAELRLNQIRESVALRRDKGFEVAKARIDTDRNKATMDDIRKLVERMHQERPNLLTVEGHATRAQLRRASYTSLAAGLVGVGAGLFAFRLARIALLQEKRERALLEDKFRAEESSEQKSTFLANVSHEIRTPMNSILGFSELLTGEIRDPRQRQYLHSLRTSAQSLLQLINDVLDMSKIDAGVMRLQPEPTDPREICEFIQTVFGEQATRKGIELTGTVVEDLPRSLLLDRTRLRQVLVNLVGNAVRFTNKGRVEVKVDWEEFEMTSSRITLLIDVKDTGCGIAKEQLDSVFEPFVQANPNRLEERQGTGLGLAIVKRLTEVMGGTVSVTSRVGEGTIFELRFPGVPVSVRLPVADKTEDETPVDFDDLVSARILVVDDTATNRELLAELFSGSHHDLHFASDGGEAVRKAQELLPDLILMDVRMPVLNGDDALREIRRTPNLELVPVIAVTASNPAEPIEGTGAEFSAHLLKPFSRRALFDELSHFLQRRQRRDPHVAGNGDAPSKSLNRERKRTWPLLVKKLRELEQSEWPSVREGLSVREVRSFAEQLQGLAREFGCRPLLAHTELLIEQCDSYAIPELERTMDGFPSLIDEIDQRSK